MKGLLYREWFIVKGKVLFSAFLFFIAAAISILVLLSFKYGNLALISESVKESIMKIFIPTVDVMPPFIAGMMIVSAGEGAARDELVSWQRFRRSTPVPAWKYAAAKYIVMTALCVICSGITIIYLSITAPLSDSALNAEKMAPAFTTVAAAIVFGIVFQLLIMFFHSVDKAGMASMGGLMVFLVIYVASSGILNERESNLALFEKLNQFCVSFFAFVPIVITAALVIGFAASAAMLKRREK